MSQRLRNHPQGTHGLENDIGLGSELLQRHNVVKGPKGSLEPQFLKALGLFGRAKINGDLVVGLSGVLDKVGEDGSPDVTWSIAIPTDHQRCQRPIKHREECYGLHTCSTDKKNTRHGLPGAQRWGVVVWSASRSSGGLCLGLYVVPPRGSLVEQWSWMSNRKRQRMMHTMAISDRGHYKVKPLT